MEKINITWTTALPIWWSFFWRVTLVSAICGAILGFFGGLVCGLAGRPELGSVVGSILGYIIGVPVSIWAFAYTLNKKFKGGYEICVIKTDSTKPTSVEEPYVKPYPSNE